MILTDGGSGGNEVDIRQRSPGEDGNKRPERPGALVDISEDLGSVASLSEGGEGAGSSVDAGHANGENGDADRHVDEVVETLDTSVGEGNDEGRCSSA